jgi:hypothetical protein
MREPTTQEMIDGIAKGFEDFLRKQPTWSPLCSESINRAIENGIARAVTADRQEFDKTKARLADKKQDNK